MAAPRSYRGIQLLHLHAERIQPRIKAIWERFTDYELGHLHRVMQLFKDVERRDPAEVLPNELPDPFKYESHRDFVRKALKEETDLRAVDGKFIDVNRESESDATITYRTQLNSEGSPSESVAFEYIWQPGTEMSRKAATV